VCVRHTSVLLLYSVIRIADDVADAIRRYINQYGWAVASAAHTCTVYVTVLVAVHRYIYVCCSHKAKRLSNLRRAKMHVVVVPVFAFCYSLPRVFEYRIRYDAALSNSTSGKPTDSNETLSAVGELQFTEIGSSFLFQIVYKNVCFYLVMYIVPLSTLVFVTVRLLATIRQRRSAVTAAMDKSSTAVHCRQQARDDSVTVVLVIIIVVFIVCQTPTLFQRLLLALTGIKAFGCGHPYYYIERLADYLAVFNSCVNFGIYVVFAPHFRRILLTDVLGLRRSRRSRRRRGNTRAGTRAAGTACAGPGVMSCAGKSGSSTAAEGAASSVATVSQQGGDGRPGSSDWSADGAAYRSEMFEVFAVSSTTPSSTNEHRHKSHQDAADDVILNGVTGGGSLPLRPLLSQHD